MTEDPVKLFVVVMAILLCVLGFVAYKTYDQASGFERAVQSAPRDAKMLREHAAEVQMLCNKLKRAGVSKGYRTLIATAARLNSVKLSSFTGPKEKKISRRGVEKRFTAKISRGGGSRAITRDQIARFCKTVETDTRGILKTIQINMQRVVGKGGKGKVGTEDVVQDDLYTVEVVFGLRVVK